MTATRPQPRKGVLEIDAYVPGKSSAPGVAKIYKLSSNETPLGPSGVSLDDSLKILATPGALLLPGT